MVLRALSQAAVSPEPLVAGDTVYVLGGGWREAVVESEADGAYLLCFGDGTRRLAALGEICWCAHVTRAVTCAAAASQRCVSAVSLEAREASS
jgi:hypothetical protein